MTKKQYQICHFIILILLSAAISISFSLQQYYLPLIFVLSAMAAMSYCRHSLKPTDVLADERDRQLAGMAASLTLNIYSLIGVVLFFVLMMLSEQQSELFAWAQYLAYSICVLLLLNALIFRYLERKGK
ncbi:MAG: putative rane protein [Patescibacteria group bacterium]|nr:putative rane protein [Patescibacteria group bacterium]